MWGPLGCLGLLLFITAMNKRITITEILPSSSRCKFNPFKNCCNPFTSDGFWKSLLSCFLVPYPIAEVVNLKEMEGTIFVGPIKMHCVCCLTLGTLSP